MAINKNHIKLEAIVPAASKPVPTQKTPAHLATVDDWATRLRVYGVPGKAGHIKTCLDNVTTPFNILEDPEKPGIFGAVGNMPEFDGSDEDKEALREHYATKILTDHHAQHAAREALVARAARLAAEKAQKAANALGKKAFKESLAIKATTPIAASALAEDAYND
jgi:hypothetical protein